MMCGRRVGHSVREKSFDRRVYTSPLGHAIPSELSSEVAKPIAPVPSHSIDVREDVTSRTIRRPRRHAIFYKLRILIFALLLVATFAAVARAVYLNLHRPPPEFHRPNSTTSSDAPMTLSLGL